MNRKKDLLISFLSAITITILFYRKPFGINLLIYEAFLLFILANSKQIQFKTKDQITIVTGLVLTSIFTIITYSTYSYIINFLALVSFIGMLIYPNAKSILTSIGLAILNSVSAQSLFFSEISAIRIKGRKIGPSLIRWKIFFIPLLILLLFIFIYRKSNPVFDEILYNIGSYISDKIGLAFINLDFLIIGIFILGLIISNFLFIRVSNKSLIDYDNDSQINHVRKKRFRFLNFKMNALKQEFRAGIFLLISLNILLLILNVIDVNWVWFNFEWEGQYLKQFVHEGTYLLIISIIISIVIVLYFFRNNLNYYSKNRTLKILSFIWLAQNAILTISVTIRNFYYIDYFSLAYKRIAVIIFLALTLYGLYTVFVKINTKKSSFYLFKSNAYAIFVVLIITSGFNWDSIIAKYNFRNSDNSFLHLNYMATLSDKTLPYIDKPLNELFVIDAIQKDNYTYELSYMPPVEYYKTIEKRKEIFINEWESKHILSWNLPEYLAYKKLMHSQ